MNGLGKSDNPTVPKKLPNKFAQKTNAEAAEGSGLTKGNGTQQVRRAPNRRQARRAISPQMA